MGEDEVVVVRDLLLDTSVVLDSNMNALF